MGTKRRSEKQRWDFIGSYLEGKWSFRVGIFHNSIWRPQKIEHLVTVKRVSQKKSWTTEILKKKCARTLFIILKYFDWPRSNLSDVTENEFWKTSKKKMKN